MHSPKHEWHIISCEYPPKLGGVADYTRSVATELASRGDSVHVWAPTSTREEQFTVHDTDGFGPVALWRLGRSLNRFPKAHLLVQWVPHGYGLRALNFFFCAWLLYRARVRGNEVELMVHEPYLPFRNGRWKQNLAAVVQRVMTILILAAADRVWISIPSWAERLKPYLLGRKTRMDWLPVPSSIQDTGATQSRTGQTRIGHFSTFGSDSAYLEQIVAALLEGDRTLVLIGSASHSFADRLLSRFPKLRGKIEATGPISAELVSQSIAECHAMIQPYQDGICGRRTSAMAALSHGKPLFTTSGSATEDIWARSGAVVMVPLERLTEIPSILDDFLANPSAMKRLGAAGKSLYDSTFDLRHTVATLREARAA